MEIRFSSDPEPFHSLSPEGLVDWSVQRHAPGRDLVVSSAKGLIVRFRLPEATQKEHDQVIRSLLTMDPDATIRTARAVYEGLADYEAQLKARRESK